MDENTSPPKFKLKH